MVYSCLLGSILREHFVEHKPLIYEEYYCICIQIVWCFPLVWSQNRNYQDTHTLDILFRQIKIFIKVHVAFVFGLRTL